VRGRYRVVWRDGATLRPLGRLADVAPTWHALDPFLSRLLLDGVARGELLLVDEGTREIVARREVRLPRRRA
jgi:hypothetical protein